MKELAKNEELLLWAVAELKGEAYGFKIRRHVSAKLGLDYTYGNFCSALGRLDPKGNAFMRAAETNRPEGEKPGSVTPFPRTAAGPSPKRMS